MYKCAFRSILITVFLSLFLVNTAAAWTIDLSFDSQSNGERCANFSTSKSVVASDKSVSGGKSCKQSITAGSSGYSEWGGIIMFPSTLSKSDEIWIRLRTYFPLGFNYDADPFLKFLRVRTETAAGDNRGYNDWYIANEGSSRPFQFVYEGRQDLGWQKIGTSSDQIQLGVWETYEFYIKFDTKSVDEGGSGRMRAWKNGILMKDMTDRVTLREATDYSNSFYLFTYWNNHSELKGPAESQSMYVDDLTITNERPLDTDNLGNPAIGMGGFVAAPALAPPKPPLVSQP